MLQTPRNFPGRFILYAAMGFPAESLAKPKDKTDAAAVGLSQTNTIYHHYCENKQTIRSKFGAYRRCFCSDSGFGVSPGMGRRLRSSRFRHIGQSHRRRQRQHGRRHLRNRNSRQFRRFRNRPQKRLNYRRFDRPAFRFADIYRHRRQIRA